MHEENRIDQAAKVPGVVDYSRPIGTERFNYREQRHEILLASGWEPVIRFNPVSPELSDMVAAVSQDVQTREAELTRENIMLRAERDAWKAFYEARPSQEVELREEIAWLRQRLWMPVEPGEHDYHGPTKRDPETGKLVPVPDVIHERFHGAIADVLAGRVITAARRQMQEALKNAPKEKPAFPVGANKDDPKRIGWRMNDAV